MMVEVVPIDLFSHDDINTEIFTHLGGLWRGKVCSVSRKWHTIAIYVSKKLFVTTTPILLRLYDYNHHDDIDAFLGQRITKKMCIDIVRDEHLYARIKETSSRMLYALGFHDKPIQINEIHNVNYFHGAGAGGHLNILKNTTYAVFAFYNAAKHGHMHILDYFGLDVPRIAYILAGYKTNNSKLLERVLPLKPHCYEYVYAIVGAAKYGDLEILKPLVAASHIRSHIRLVEKEWDDLMHSLSHRGLKHIIEYLNMYRNRLVV